jgi:hypothetical protein
VSLLKTVIRIRVPSRAVHANILPCAELCRARRCPPFAHNRGQTWSGTRDHNGPKIVEICGSWAYSPLLLRVLIALVMRGSSVRIRQGALIKEPKIRLFSRGPHGKGFYLSSKSGPASQTGRALSQNQRRRNRRFRIDMSCSSVRFLRPCRSGPPHKFSNEGRETETPDT